MEKDDNDLNVHISVVHDAITVTMPFSHLPQARWALAPRVGHSRWQEAPISKWTFWARAWTAPNEKAHELGWIVWSKGVPKRCRLRGFPTALLTWPTNAGSLQY